MEREIQQNGQEEALIVTGIDQRHGLLPADRRYAGLGEKYNF